VNTGVRIISAANISKGLIKFDRKERFISQSTYEKWMPIALTRGDVILTSEAPLGEVAQVDFDEPIAIGQRLYALRGKSDRISNDYLRYFLTSMRGKSELRARETGATAIGIRQSELVQLQVPIISLELQIERIQLLKQVELLVGELSSQLNRKIRLCNELNNSILSSFLTFDSEEEAVA
jgi:type I restriction enzyme S subunit